MAEYIYLKTGEIIEAEATAKTHRNPNLIQVMGARINQGEEKYELFIPVSMIKYISNKRIKEEER